MSRPGLQLTSGCLLAAVMIIAGSAVMLYNYAGELLIPADVQDSGSDHIYEDRSISDTLPDFYRALANEKGSFKVIEYPALVQDAFNPLPDYQAYHRKKIFNGYFKSHALKKEWDVERIINTGIWPAEIIASRLENNKLDLSGTINLLDNFIDLYDIRSILRSGSKYIILHQRIRDEITAVKDLAASEKALLEKNNSIQALEQTSRFTRHFKAYYTQYFGRPVYEDDLLIVFEVSG